MNNKQLYQITAASLEKYLLFLDWVRDYDFPNKNMMVFKKDKRTLAMPATEKFDDFYSVLPTIIDVLSDFYDKTAREVVKEIVTSYHDWMEFRIKSEVSDDGVLPLGYASNCIEGLKELILYSACAEQSKEPICMRTTNNAKHVLDNFKLAQTEVGSFIINIDIKVADEENEQFTLPDCEPAASLEHKVVRRIGTAIQQIDDVTKEQVKLDEMLPTAYESGVTANICDALMKLKPDNIDAEIEAKIRYATAISQRPGCVETVQIKNNHFYTMNEIAERYRSVENTKRITIHGSIKSLDKVKIGQHRYQRSISVVAFVDGKDRIVKVELGDEDHRMACNAFRDEYAVEITGELDMNKRPWKIIHVEDFKIVSD